MLSVTNLEGRVEALNNYQRFEMNEEVNGAFTVALTSFFVPNNPGHLLLEEESIIGVHGYDFRVKQMKEQRNRKEIVGISTFYDQAATWKEEIYGGTRQFKDFADFLFRDTGWTYTNIDVAGIRFIPNFGGDNIVKMVQGLCAAYECEYKILPDKKIQFAKQIGPDNDAQYRYAHNVAALSRSVDTTNLRTKVVAYGGGGMNVVYTSPNAAIFGELYAEPVSDERFTIAENLLEKARQSIIDYPEVSFELDTIELTDKELGERVWMIYEPMGIEFQTRIHSKKSVERQGRIVTASVVIGNTVQKSLSDILAQQKIDIDETARQTRSRIEQTNDSIEFAVERFTSDMLEAYSQISLTAEEIRSEVAAKNVELEEGIADNLATITQTAESIRADVKSDIKRVDGSIEALSGTITQTAESIRADIKKDVTRLDGSIDALSSSITQTATSIRTEIAEEVRGINGDINSANTAITQLSNSVTSVVNTTTNLNGRVSSAETSIEQHATAISSKVAITSFTGEAIVSKINQTPWYVEIEAAKINLVGAVTVLSDISGNLGSITAGNINIHSEAYIGAGLHLRGPSNYTGIYFGSTQIMQDSTGRLNLGNNVQIGQNTTFNGLVDFSRASVSGLPKDPITFRYSAASKRLYVDQYNAQVGFVSLT